MVRAYDPSRPVPQETVERIARHAQRAPSAGYSQGWGFLFLTEQADRDRFWAATDLDPSDPNAGTAAAAGLAEWRAGMMTAPLIVVAHSCKDVYLDRYARDDKGWSDRAEDRWPVPYWDVDTGMAALLVLLTAVDEGLGACLFGIMPGEIPRYRAEFGVPDSYTPVGAITVGYPAPSDARLTPERKASFQERKRPVEDVVHYGQWKTARE